MASKKTLVVDDSMSTRMMIVAMLGKLCPDWEVTQAIDGGDALAGLGDLALAPGGRGGDKERETTCQGQTQPAH